MTSILRHSNSSFHYSNLILLHSLFQYRNGMLVRIAPFIIHYFNTEMVADPFAYESMAPNHCMHRSRPTPTTFPSTHGSQPLLFIKLLHRFGAFVLLIDGVGMCVVDWRMMSPLYSISFAPLEFLNCAIRALTLTIRALTFDRVLLRADDFIYICIYYLLKQSEKTEIFISKMTARTCTVFSKCARGREVNQEIVANGSNNTTNALNARGTVRSTRK